MTHDRYPKKLRELLATAVLATAWTAPSLSAQTTEPEKETEEKKKEDVVQLAPFQVNTTQDKGYAASSSLAGSRLNTELVQRGAPPSRWSRRSS